MFNKNVSNIVMWTKFEEEKERIEEIRENKLVLPNIKIPNNIKFTTDINYAIKNSNLIVIAVPAGFVNDISILLKDIITDKQHILIASKGIERNTCSFVHDILLRHIKTDNLAVISGPSFAIDVSNNEPVGLSLGTKNKETEKLIKRTLENDTLNLEQLMIL